MASKECFRITLWMCWVTNMLITTIYYLLSAVTFYKLLTASGEAAIDLESLVMNRVWRAPLAATFLGALLVFGFNIFSCCILIKKSINRSGPGFGYGFLVAFCFTLAFFCLLIGLIMNSFIPVLNDTLEGLTSWTKYSTDLYVGAEVFAFLCFAMLLIFFLALVIFQGAVSDQLGITRDMANPYVPMAAGSVPLAATAGAGPSTSAGPQGKAPSSSDPQYAQFSAGEYMASDQYNNNQQQANYSQYYNTQDYQQADYQQAGEYQPTDYQNTTEYVYDQEPGYQAPYDNAYNAAGSATATPNYNAQPAGGYSNNAYAAPPYQQTDYSSAAAAAFHSQQGGLAGTGSRRAEQQL